MRRGIHERAVKRSLLAPVGLVLALAAPASARDLPSPTPDAGTAAFSRDVTLIATNASRTLAGGLFTSAGVPRYGVVALDAASGAVSASGAAGLTGNAL